MIDLTPERLAALKAVALAATGGEWRACIGSALGQTVPSEEDFRRVSAGEESCSCRMVYAGEGPPIVVAVSEADENYTAGEGVDASQARANARYVALASPAVVLGLLERIDRL